MADNRNPLRVQIGLKDSHLKVLYTEGKKVYSITLASSSGINPENIDSLGRYLARDCRTEVEVRNLEGFTPLKDDEKARLEEAVAKELQAIAPSSQQIS